MNCDVHPDREGVAACVVCGKILCEDCRLRLAGKNYCQECADLLVEEKSTPEPDFTVPERPERRGGGLLRRILISAIIVIAILLAAFYIIYVLYLAPYYGDIQNVLEILTNDPERILRFLAGQGGF